MEETTLETRRPERKIQELSDQLISQIAAGEVVERPASVVKELVENAIDAGADSVEVRIEGGGIKRIVVSDNGCGIPKDQLALAVKRHATSKVSNLDELESVSSLGFRGEALASIASVSDMKVISRVAGEDAFSIADGEISAASGNKGTRIEVADLFYKTPARRKFLKSEGTEAAHCQTVIERIALAYPEVAFLFVANGKPIINLPASSIEERLTRLMPRDFRDAHRALDIKAPALRLYGWVCLPTAARSRADCQYFYVNGRFVRDKVLSHGVRMAYQDVLHGSSQPSYCLFLQMDPHKVDVNVHPTKSEVRMRDSQAIHQFIFHAVEDALARTTIVDSSSGEIMDTALPSSPRDASAQAPAEAPVAPTVNPSSFRPAQPKPSRTNTEAYLDFSSPHPKSFQNSFPTTIAAMKVDPATLSANHATPKPAAEAPKRPQPLGRAVGQVCGTFIIAENSAGMVLVDMHAAHERILYERLKKSFDERKMPMQEMLIPLVFTVTPEQMATFEDAREELEQLGLELSAVGPNQLSGVAAVVTRYFGGIKLGAGGLVRAYTGSVSKAVQSCGLARKILMGTFALSADAADAGKLLNIIYQQQLFTVASVEYGQQARILLYMKQEQQDEAERWLTEALNTATQLEQVGSEYVEVPAEREK